MAALVLGPVFAGSGLLGRSSSQTSTHKAHGYVFCLRLLSGRFVLCSVADVLADREAPTTVGAEVFLSLLLSFLNSVQFLVRSTTVRNVQFLIRSMFGFWYVRCNTYYNIWACLPDSHGPALPSIGRPSPNGLCCFLLCPASSLYLWLNGEFLAKSIYCDPVYKPRPRTAV